MMRKLSLAAAIAGALLMPAAPLAAYGGGSGEGGMSAHSGLRGGHGGFRGGHAGGHLGWHGAHFGTWQSGGHFWHGRWWGYGFDPCWEWTTSGWLWICY